MVDEDCPHIEKLVASSEREGGRDFMCGFTKEDCISDDHRVCPTSLYSGKSNGDGNG